MNFLAHLFLSGDSDEVKIGNFIGDYVKGNAYKKYSDNVQKGILLHRGIDTFTDAHPIVRSTKAYFQKNYRKYSGIIVDILFDHFLSKNWSAYSQQSLSDFLRSVYQLLERKYDMLPSEVQEFVPSFIKRDWIRTYQSIEGIELVLTGMSVRTTLPDNAVAARQIIEENYELFYTYFTAYFPLLIDFVERKFGIKIPRP